MSVSERLIFLFVWVVLWGFFLRLLAQIGGWQ